MPVLLDSGNLLVGNGDVFLQPTVSTLPSVSTYKTARTSGTLKSMTSYGILGAVKGTVHVQLIREIISLELNTPQEVVDQTVIREGCHFKCALAELSLATVQAQLGSPNSTYSVASAGATLVSLEPITMAVSSPGNDGLASPIKNAPILFTGSTPAAAFNPEVLDAASTTSGDSGGTGLNSVGGANILLANTAIANLDTGDTLLVDSEQITVGTIASGTSITGCTRGVNGTTPAVHALGAPVYRIYVRYTDYELNEITNTITPTHGGDLFTNGYAILMNYYYNQLSSETLTGGGLSVLQTNAVGFFHPYKDGRVGRFRMFAANPVGTVTLPFEEVQYTHSEFELRAIADFTQPVGSHLWDFYREIPLT